MRHVPIVVLLVSLSLGSCSHKSEEELFSLGTEAAKAGEADKAIDAYEDLLEEYPQGTHRPEVLYALGSIYQNEKGDLRRALVCYREIVDRYPEHEKSPNALFLMGFIYNNELHQLDSARTAYEAFLKRYPTNEMASSAQFELSHLGQSPEELIRPQEPATRTGKTMAKKPTGQ